MCTGYDEIKSNLKGSVFMFMNWGMIHVPDANQINIQYSVDAFLIHFNLEPDIEFRLYMNSTFEDSTVC